MSSSDFATPDSTKSSAFKFATSDDIGFQIRQSTYYIMEALFIELDPRKNAIRSVRAICVFRN